MGTGEMDFGQLLKAGGPMMWPLLICSVITAAIVLEKLLYFYRIRTDSHKLKVDVFALLKDTHVQEAVDRCQRDSSPLARILKAGILKFGQSRESIKEGMEEVSLEEIPKLESKLAALSTVAQVAPLLGLMGSVAGMCASFHAVEIRAAGMNPVMPGDLAGGIWAALLTTVGGLAVAIPAFIFYQYLVSRVKGIVLEMERGATQLLNFLCRIDEVNRSAHEV